MRTITSSTPQKTPQLPGKSLLSEKTAIITVLVGGIIIILGVFFQRNMLPIESIGTIGAEVIIGTGEVITFCGLTALFQVVKAYKEKQPVVQKKPEKPFFERLKASLKTKKAAIIIAAVGGIFILIGMLFKMHVLPYAAIDLVGVASFIGTGGVITLCGLSALYYIYKTVPPPPPSQDSRG